MAPNPEKKDFHSPEINAFYNSERKEYYDEFVGKLWNVDYETARGYLEGSLAAKKEMQTESVGSLLEAGRFSEAIRKNETPPAQETQDTILEVQTLPPAPNTKLAIEMNVKRFGVPLKNFAGVRHKQVFLVTPDLKVVAEVYVPYPSIYNLKSKLIRRDRETFLNYFDPILEKIREALVDPRAGLNDPKITIHPENIPEEGQLRLRARGVRDSLITEPTLMPSYIDSHWNAARRPSDEYPGETQFEVVDRSFTKAFKEVPLYKLLTPEAQRELREITIYGQVVVESGWNRRNYSRDGNGEKLAFGMFQLIRSSARKLIINYPDLVPEDSGYHALARSLVDAQDERATRFREEAEEEQFLYQIELSSALAAAHHDSLYNAINQDNLLDEFAAKFGLNTKSTNFQVGMLIPLMITGYHQGAARILSILRWSIANITKEDLEEEIEGPPYGRDLFWYLTKRYYLKPNPDGFGPLGRNYYYSIWTIRKLMMEKAGVEALAIEQEPVERRETPSIKEMYRSVMDKMREFFDILIPRKRWRYEFTRMNRRGRKERTGLYDLNERKVAVMGSSTAVGVSLYTKKTDTAARSGLNPWRLDELLEGEVFPEMEKRKISMPKIVIIMGTATNAFTSPGDPFIVDNTIEKYKELAAKLKDIGVERVIFATLQPYKEEYDKILEFNNRLRAEARGNPNFEIFEIYGRNRLRPQEAERMKNSGALHLPTAAVKRIAAEIDAMSQEEPLLPELPPETSPEPPLVPAPEPEPEPETEPAPAPETEPETEPAPELEPAVNGEICEPPAFDSQEREPLKIEIRLPEGPVRAERRHGIEKIEPSVVTATLVILQDDISLHPPAGWEASVATSESGPGVYVYTVTFTNSSTGKTAKVDISELLKDPVTPGRYELKAPILE